MLADTVCYNKDWIEDTITYSYKLDKFQEDAIESIESGNHILVTSHTSSGKSTIAEFAIAKAIQLNKKIYYTCPIKALSNQKFEDIRRDAIQRYKTTKDNVGILTGDMKINPDANIIVATTEIVRNLLSKSLEYFDNVYAIIFDEVHYIKDRDRGHIWEESIALAPKHIILVMLSASISDAQLLQNWVTNIKDKKTNLITTKYRPVPLTHQYYHHFDKKSYEIMNNKNEFYSNNYCINKSLVKPPGKKATYKELNPSKHAKLKSIVDYVSKNDDDNNNLLPCLMFVFSRSKCDQYANDCDCKLLEGKECVDACNLYDEYVRRYIGSDAEKLEQIYKIRTYIQKGIAIHHSGLLPILKEIIEILFSKKYIKILFVTETFSVGINMPTRCVVFTDLKKFDGDDERLLLPEEYIQMAGRAGRRGLDKQGMVIYAPLEKPLDYSEIYSIYKGKQQSIYSNFEITPSLMLQCIMYKHSIYELTNSTYYHNEYIRYIRSLENDLDQLDISKDDPNYDSCIELVELDKQYNCISNQSARKQNRKKTRSLRVQINLSDDILDKKLQDISRSINIHYEIDRSKEYYNDKFEIAMQYLEYVGLVIDNKITPMGIVCTQFNELPDLFMTNILYNGILERIAEDELFALLCCLIDDRSIVTTKIINKQIDSAFKIIEQIYNDYIKLQNKYNYTCNYKLSPGFIEYGIYWYQEKTFVEIQALIPNIIYGGNFVKNMLKLITIIDELVLACNILQLHDLIIKLHNAQSKIIRDIVSADSVHLH